jgi:Zn-dependent peptidase ImmA (M78 family)
LPANAKKLRRDLRKLGLSGPAISAAWPAWWSDEAELSASARAELRFSLARKLGLDPRSLFNDDSPRFVWRDETKFKRISSETERELSAISAFGSSIARALVAATAAGPSIEGLNAERLRNSILAKQTYVRLVDLLGLCWALGIPVIHLRVFPLSAKRMCAMTVRISERYAVLLGKDAEYPAPIAYYLAHEIGHVALGHLKAGAAVVDLQDPLKPTKVADADEIGADAFALELLTGKPEFTVDTKTRRFTAAQLAQTLLETAEGTRVEPGTLALCFGHSTGQWAKANAALRAIYTTSRPVWAEVNQIAARELDWTTMPEDLALFARAVMGGVPNIEGGG